MVCSCVAYALIPSILQRSNRYLNLEGADEPSEGPYATSIPLMHAMNPANDVLLVFGQNGRVLHPDHGYVRLVCDTTLFTPDMVLQPLRIIIPGFVGGRQVKWLKKVRARTAELPSR